MGLDHFEGRSWNGWHRHVTLTAAVQLFLTQLRRTGKHRAGLSLYAVLREVQYLLAIWLGFCPLCHQPVPT